MPKFTKLSNIDHKSLKVSENCAIKLASTQHIISIKITEVARAVSNFPVFMSKAPGTDGWEISAVAGLEIASNLFVKDQQWDASYLPTTMQTYPFYLTQSEEEGSGFTVVINETSEDFSDQDGAALFDESGQASIFLNRLIGLLEADIKNELHTLKFVEKLAEIGLIKAVDILVHYESGSISAVSGLHTIDEDKLKSISDEEFAELRQRGYLAPIYAMLISIYQLNSLLQRHNAVDGSKRIVQVNVENSKSAV